MRRPNPKRMVRKVGAGLIAFTLALGILPLGSQASREPACDGQHTAHSMMGRVGAAIDEGCVAERGEVLLDDEPR